MRAWLLVLALAGCDRAFGLGDPYQDAPSGDGIASDAPIDMGMTSADTGSGTRMPALLGHWAFDGDTTNPVSGLQAPCIGTGSCGYGTGVHGMAVTLDGNSCLHGYVPATPSQFTLMLWINPTNTTSSTLLSRPDQPNGMNYPWKIDATSSNFGFMMWTGSVSTRIAATPGLMVGSWHNIAVTYDGTDKRVFIDAVQRNSLGSIGVMYGSGPDVYFGCEEQGNQYFTGSIDDVYIFDGALTSAEIASRM